MIQDLTPEELGELAAWSQELIEQHGWQLFKRLFEFKCQELNKQVMNSREHLPREKGQFNGMTMVINKPYELIETFNQSDEVSDT